MSKQWKISGHPTQEKLLSLLLHSLNFSIFTLRSFCARSNFWHFKRSPCEIMCWALHLNKWVLETEKSPLLFLYNWGIQIIIIISPLHEFKMKKIHFCLWVRVKMTSFCCRLLLLFPTDPARPVLSCLVPPTEFSEFTSSSVRVHSGRKHAVWGNNVKETIFNCISILPECFGMSVTVVTAGTL